jgi:DtxR family transcriptional regulator, Mn-dependent transcriptional regulator
LHDLYVEQETTARVPAVSRMTLRMLRRKFVERTGACGIVLTATGRALAAGQVRRQRIVEAYLVRALGYHWTDVYEPAQRFSETLADEMIDRMFGLAGQPGHCPHGCPIPHTPAASQTGTGSAARLVGIADIRVGARMRVARVRSQDVALLRYIDQCGIRPGAHVEYSGRAPFGDVVRLRTTSGEEAISASVAQLLLFEVAA